MTKYQLFNTSNVMGWHLIEEGQYFGNSVAMSTSCDKFCLLEVQNPTSAAPARRGTIFRRKEEKPAAGPTIARFVIKEFNEAGTKILQDTATPPHPVQRIFGGQLLGLTLQNAQPCAPSDQFFFQFYKWDGFADANKVGPQLPVPKAVVWDATRPLVAIIFKQSFSIYNLQLGDKEPLTLVSMHRIPIQSFLWSDSCVFFSTEDSIKCCLCSFPSSFSIFHSSYMCFGCLFPTVFMNNNDEAITVASNTAEGISPAEETPFASTTRPIGPLSLVAYREDVSNFLLLLHLLFEPF